MSQSLRFILIEYTLNLFSAYQKAYFDVKKQLLFERAQELLKKSQRCYSEILKRKGQEI